MGIDYWRNPTIGYGPGGNNHEAGASNWYFPSKKAGSRLRRYKKRIKPPL
jgi:hypothetical protein